MLERLMTLIEDAVADQHIHGGLSEALRFAALVALEEVKGVTAREFGDAADALELHRQGAINRFNETKKMFENLI